MTPAESALLVVDDNEDNRYTLTRRLKREGYAKVVTANDGRQALEILKEQQIDLMLLDIMMPEMDGYQVLERIKADASLRDIPVIMISALEEIESVIRCVELGAEDYLPKPFNPTLLRARVGASLEKKRLRDEVRSSLARLEQELEAARALQLGMLPGGVPAVSAAQPFQVHGFMDPAREVGGDLYDFFYAPDGTFCFLIGDISGKGAGAAMFMARTRSLARMAVVELLPRLPEDQRNPAFIAEVLNRELSQNNRERMFVTLFLGFVDPADGGLRYINAGHPLPYILRADGRLERLTGKPQPPLAVRSATRYGQHAARLDPGDALFAYTDGVLEAMADGGELYSAARLEAQLRAAAGAAPDALVQSVRLDVDGFAAGASKSDDVTMLAVRRHPQPHPAAVGIQDGPGRTAAAAPADTTELVLPNDLTQLEPLRAAMARIGARHAIAQKPLFDLQVALDEMVSNVIKYAWPEGGSHEIQVRITVRSGQVEIEIADDGKPFDPLEARAPPVPEPGRRPKPGGLGVHMLRQLVERIDYARVDGRNHLKMIKTCDVVM